MESPALILMNLLETDSGPLGAVVAANAHDKVVECDACCFCQGRSDAECEGSQQNLCLDRTYGNPADWQVATDRDYQPHMRRIGEDKIGGQRQKKDEGLFCSAVESLGLKDDVKLLSPKYGEDKWRHFLTCDVFVHTSRTEGIPTAVMEAMALGRPCLVTPQTNMARIVCEGGGWKCQGDPTSIAEAIKSIYEKRDSLKVLGQWSRELMRRRFMRNRIANQLKQEYLKVMASFME